MFYLTDAFTPLHLEARREDSAKEYTKATRIGFAGAHRTGKTTLAEYVAQELGIRFHATNIADAPVWKEIHSSPSDQFTFAERLEIQHRLLDYMEKQLEANDEKAFVTDRTPLDLLGYLFANVDSTCSDLWADSARSLVSRAIRLADKHFDRIFLVQPAISTADSSGKRGKVYMSGIYQTAINNNILAFGFNYLHPDKFVVVPASAMKFEDPVAYVVKRI